MNKESYRKLIGKQLKTISQKKGLSAYKIAQKGNIRIDQVQAVESGEKNYTIDALIGYIQGSGILDFDNLKNKEIIINVE